MEAVEKLRSNFRKNANAVESARGVLICMTFIGFVISGIVEHGITVVLSPSDLGLKITGRTEGNGTRSRRYCDPPNMTAMAIYYDSNEETNEVEDNYDFSQLQEMYFQADLSSNEKVESLLKKFFLWGNFFSMVPASRLAVNIGPKKVFGYSLLGAAASTLLVPAAWLTTSHVIVRFLQGLFCGGLIPSAHSLAINWFPATRRNSFVSLYSGTYVGYALCELLTGKFVSLLGPGSIYYITGFLSLAWFVPWSMMVFNTPELHLKYTGCEKSPGPSTSPKQTIWNFPARHFICSRPLWMSIGAIFGSYCGQISITVGMRSYLKYVYGVSDGFLSAVPFALHVVFAIACGYLVNYMQKIQFVSLTSSRRIVIYISHFIPAGFLFVVGFVGCGVTAPVFLYSLAIVVSGATYSGAISSTLDIAPNHAGTIVAFCCTFGTAGSILMSYLISSVLDGEMPGSWRLTFSLTSLILLVTAILFMLRGSGAIQPWNDPDYLEKELSSAGVKNDESKEPLSEGVPLSAKPRTKSIYMVEQKILKVLHVQEPEKFQRARAYSTSLPNDIYRPTRKKRASIS